jgi:hypothetical protein
VARASSNDSPENWFGTRTVIVRTGPCGWCMTGDCKNCNHELGYYEKLWICGCDCNKDWQPVAVVVERKVDDSKVTKPRASTRARKESTDAVGARTEGSETEA